MFRRSALVIAVAAVSLVGCGNYPPAEVAAQRQESYRTLAYVCVPGQEADPSYRDSIMDTVAKQSVTRLDFLDKVDVLTNVPVDLSQDPPKPNLTAASQYNVLALLVYSYHGNEVVLMTYMYDTTTGECVWTREEMRHDADISGRLERHAYWAPTYIKGGFYGRR